MERKHKSKQTDFRIQSSNSQEEEQLYLAKIRPIAQWLLLLVRIMCCVFKWLGLSLSLIAFVLMDAMEVNEDRVLSCE